MSARQIKKYKINSFIMQIFLKSNTLCCPHFLKVIMNKSIYKTISYRIIMLAFSYCMARLFNMDNEKSVVFMIVWNVSTTIIYYIHERLWSRR